MIQARHLSRSSASFKDVLQSLEIQCPLSSAAMWPKSRPPTASYQPLQDNEQHHNQNGQSQGVSLWPRASIPSDQLLGGDNAIKREHLLGGNNKINHSLLLGGNKPIAEHLLMQPRQQGSEDEVKHEETDVVDDDFEHLDYLEPTDDMPLTSRKRFKRLLPRISYRSAVIAATVLVLLICGITVIFALGGEQHPFGPGDYKI